jgi:uncharacterized protein (DUF983 family)
MHTKTEFQIARPRQALRFLGRALRLRCPNCGGGPVLQHWLKLRVRCGACGLRLERGEHDYFVGSLMINFIVTGTLLLVTIAVLLVWLYPDVPWNALQYGGPLAMIAAPFVIFPFSKLLWLAFDLMFRPVSPEELEWHRTADSAFSTDQPVER